jgi:hypothetical protein
MDTIVPVTLPQVAKFMEALASRGVGKDELQRVLDDVVTINKVAALMVPAIDIGLDISGEFDTKAMLKLVKHVFKDYINHQRMIERDHAVSPHRYTWLPGSNLEDIATTEVMKELLDGLGNRHVAVAVLRSGLLDGHEVVVNEVAARLGLSGSKGAKQVTQLRSQANAHIKARQRELYPFGRWVRRTNLSEITYQTLTAASPIEDMRLNRKAYNLLKHAGINTVGDLLKKSLDDLLDIRNLGRSHVDQIALILDASNLYLRQD